MMNRLLILGIVFTALLLMLSSAAALTLGAAGKSPSPTLATFDACDLPCWNAITPGVTPFADADSILRALRYRQWETGIYDYTAYLAPRASDWCDAWLHTGNMMTVTSVWLRDCPRLRLGDLMTRLGKPERLLIGGDFLYWRDGLVMVSLMPKAIPVWSSPDGDVSQLFLLSFDDTNGAGLPWRGFMPRWRFCQLEPTAPGGYCS